MEFFENLEFPKSQNTQIVPKCYQAGRLLSFWRSGRSGVLANLAGPPIWLPIWRRSGGGQSGAILTVLATAPFWRRSWYQLVPAGAQLVPSWYQLVPSLALELVQRQIGHFAR